MVITRIGPISLAKIAGVLYGGIGLLAGALISVWALAGAAAGHGSGPAFLPSFIGVGAVIALPIFYGGLGFIGTLIAAALFNFAARLVGGVEIDIK